MAHTERHKKYLKEKKERRAIIEEKRKKFLDKYKEEKEKRKQLIEVRDVEGKVIPDRGPHSTYEGKMGERARGYIRKTKKDMDAALAESKKKKRRTHLGTIRKIYANEHPKYKGNNKQD